MTILFKKHKLDWDTFDTAILLEQLRLLHKKPEMLDDESIVAEAFIRVYTTHVRILAEELKTFLFKSSRLLHFQIDFGKCPERSGRSRV